MNTRGVVVLLSAIICLSYPASAQWAQTGGPHTGHFNAMINATSSAILAGTSTGCYRSTDNGTAWTNVLTWPTYTLAGGSFLDVYAGTSDGLFRSTNGGTAWSKVRYPGSSSSVKAVASGSGVLFVSTSSKLYRSTNNELTWDSLKLSDVTFILIRPNAIVVAVNPAGIHRSTNGGDIWTKVFSLSANASIKGITVTPGGNLLASGDLDKTPYRNVFLRSTNEGGTWNEEEMNPPVAPASLDNGNGYTFVATEYAYDPLYIDCAVYRSTDNGHSWSKRWTIRGSVTSLAALSKGIVFAGGWGGIARSLDTGKTWTALDTDIGSWHTVYALGISPSGFYFAGTTDGIFRSTDDGARWEPSYMDPAARLVRSIGIGTHGYVFTGIGYYGAYLPNSMYRSTTGGNSWSDTGPVLALDVRCQAALPGGEMVAGTEENNAKHGGVYHTTSSGMSWSPPVSRMDSVVTAIATNAAGHIFAGTKQGAIARSTDGGTSWSPKNPAVLTEVLSLASSGKGYWFAGTTNGILRSTNSGTTWTAVNSGLGDHNVRALVVDTEGIVYAGTADGVYRSTNDGGTWTDFNTNLGHRGILSLAIDSVGFLLAGTRGGGVYKSTLVKTGIENGALPRPASFALDQNYPNPFNPVTTIGYSVPGPVSALTRIAVFDLLGREVTVLVHEKKGSGVYAVQWNARGMASGIYYCRMNAGAFVQTRTMLLLR